MTRKPGLWATAHQRCTVLVQFTLHIIVGQVLQGICFKHPSVHRLGYSSCFMMTTWSDEHMLYAVCFDVSATQNPSQNLFVNLLAPLHPRMGSYLRFHFHLPILSCYGWSSQVLLYVEICYWSTQTLVCVFVPKVHGKIISWAQEGKTHPSWVCL